MDWLYELIQRLIQLLREALRRLEDERSGRGAQRRRDPDETSVDELELRDDPELISPPVVAQPLYACAEAVVLLSFLPHADIEIQVDGVAAVATTAAFPEPSGQAFMLPAPLMAGQLVRARQGSGGVVSDWSEPVVVIDHTLHYPAGPPRPQINPAPVHECGSRTGVANLLTGCTVWITADAADVGKVAGAKEHQGVNVTPDYSLGQDTIAYASLCDDESPPSQTHLTQPPPAPLPTPLVDPTYEGAEQIRITGLANGARFTLQRSGVDQGTWRTWGQVHLVTLSPSLGAGEHLTIQQRLCPGDPPSGEGSTSVLPCAQLPAPQLGPIQDGDSVVHVTSAAPGAVIKVFVNLVKRGESTGSPIPLTAPVEHGDVVHVIQALGTCSSSTAREVAVACVAPPVGPNPAALDLFPVGHTAYDGGSFSFDGTTYSIRGTVHYPADSDGADTPFRRRLAELGRVPIVFMAHGNHATFANPADRTQEACHDPGGWIEIPNHEGYDYFQAQLARMGIVAVSVYSNETNCTGYSTTNMRHRAEVIIRSIEHLQALDASGHGIFAGRLDFSRVGLMGHSRGGEAVVVVPEVIGLSGVTIAAVLSLAPTDAGASSGHPARYPFLTILPAADGDVRSNAGARFYDRASPDPLRCQVYVHGAGHNLFNREWPNNDAVGPAQLSRIQHENVLSAYGCALFRFALLGHPTVGYLTGRVRPAGVRTDRVHLSYAWRDNTTVDDHEQPGGIATNSLGAPTAQMDGLVADEVDDHQVWAACSSGDSTYFGLTSRMEAWTLRRDGQFRSELDTVHDLTDREVWVRAAEVHDPPTVPSTGTSFELGLEDRHGVVAWVPVDHVGGLARPYDRGDCFVKTMLTTSRFPTACYAAEEGDLDITQIVALRLRLPDATDERRVAFDDLQIAARSEP
jgi:hypothetical protein